jgi:sugar diacid utilization regulator
LCRCLYACGREEKKKKLRWWVTTERAKWVLGEEKKNLSEPKQSLRQAADYMRVGEKRKKKKIKIVGYLQRELNGF